MTTIGTRSIYEELGVRRVINALGSATIVGGSQLTSKILRAMEAANEYFVDMEELLDKSGQEIARILGAEAALVTSGCFAALVLGTAGILTGKDLRKVAQLPNARGIKNEFLLQRPMRYHYDRCISVPGGKLVEVGTKNGCSAEQLESAIGPKTAGIFYLASAEYKEGVLRIPEVVRIAKKHKLAVLVDAAGEVYPLDRMTWLASESGADLVCFGAKYVGSTHSTGIICGKKDAVEAAVLNNFIAFETHDNHCIGRGYKVDRQEVIATVFALRDWFSMNHEDRFAVQERRIKTIEDALTRLPNVKTERTWERQGPWIRLRVTVDERGLGKTAASVEQALRNSDPSVRLRCYGNQLVLTCHLLNDGEEKIVAERMRQALSR